MMMDRSEPLIKACRDNAHIVATAQLPAEGRAADRVAPITSGESGDVDNRILIPKRQDRSRTRELNQSDIAPRTGPAVWWLALARKAVLACCNASVFAPEYSRFQGILQIGKTTQQTESV